MLRCVFTPRTHRRLQPLQACRSSARGIGRVAQRIDACRQVGCDVINDGTTPAKALISGAPVAHHCIKRVYTAVEYHPGRAQQRPHQRRGHRIRGVFRQRLHCRARHALSIELLRIAGAQPRHPRACALNISIDIEVAVNTPPHPAQRMPAKGGPHSKAQQAFPRDGLGTRRRQSAGSPLQRNRPCHRWSDCRNPIDDAGGACVAIQCAFQPCGVMPKPCHWVVALGVTKHTVGGDPRNQAPWKTHWHAHLNPQARKHYARS